MMATCRALGKSSLFAAVVLGTSAGSVVGPQDIRAGGREGPTFEDRCPRRQREAHLEAFAKLLRKTRKCARPTPSSACAFAAAAHNPPARRPHAAKAILQ